MEVPLSNSVRITPQSPANPFVNPLSASEEPAKKTIAVPNDWSAKEGVKLDERYTVGPALGKGLQGGVYSLLNPDGSVDQLHVLKCAHKFAPLVALRREWEVGLRVYNVADLEHALPGFMGTAEGVVNEKGVFRGMLLERLQGQDTLKVVDKDGFHDIAYLREMMFTALTALDIAQRSVGFHHSDFRVANIMELTGEQPPKRGPNGPEQLGRFRVIDFGLAQFDEDYARGRVNLKDTRGEKVHRKSKPGIQEGPEDAPKRKGRFLPKPLAVSQLTSLPELKPLDRLYRAMWRDRSDVYSLVWDLIRYVDGLVWLKKDEREVRLLMAFIRHVSGMRCRCYFVEEPQDKVQGCNPCGPLRYNSGGLHWWRVRYIRIGAWIRPRNPGLTAAEALTAPFFDPCKSDNDHAE